MILKLIDWLIINIFGQILRLDDFQCGFQSLSSTSLCSWVVYETIDHYIRNGSTVYGVLMDCTKAFDTVQHSLLFQKLLDAGLPPVIVRLLISIYLNQEANVRWKSDSSHKFKIKNGVRQGGVLSPILFCFYMNDLFGELQRCRSGCMIGDYYAGVHGYADDLLLLCPSRSGLQEMVDICDKYARRHKIQFSTNPDKKKSKTKGIIFSKKALSFEPAPIFLCGLPLPWVKESKYLGNVLEDIPNGYQQDVRVKRAQFIERNCELNREFPLAHPDVKSKINRIFNSSFPGSVLWDLSGINTTQLINSWSVVVRHMWSLPDNSHRFFIEALGGPHAKLMLMCRYVNFVRNINKSSRPAAIYLLNRSMKNVNTVTCRNIHYILKETGESDILTVNIGQLKKNYHFVQMNPDDAWKIDFVREITNVKQNVLEIDQNQMTDEELSDIVDYLTTI